nr:MAG TPA: hypothetical protein [Caudoviricetes sp.]
MELDRRKSVPAGISGGVGGMMRAPRQQKSARAAATALGAKE